MALFLYLLLFSLSFAGAGALKPTVDEGLSEVVVQREVSVAFVDKFSNTIH